MRYVRPVIISAGCFICLLFMSVTRNSAAAELIYTIQTGSFISYEAAGNEFELITKVLNKHELGHLRVEKIGKYYSVRLGKFDSREAAEAFLETVKGRIASSIIIDAYIKSDRIMKSYANIVPDSVRTADTKPDAGPSPGKTGPRRTEKAGAKPVTDKLFYTIQAGSFTGVSDAEKQFNSIRRELDQAGIDHLRVEKIGKYYSVRLGKFTSRERVEAQYKIIKASIPESVILNAYVKDERIIKSIDSPEAEQHVGPVELKKETNSKTAVKPATAQVRESTGPDKMFYMIQAGTYAELGDAQKRFDAIVNILNAEDPAYLRIERTGSQFAVRLGKYDDYASARKLLEKIKAELKDSVIVYDNYIEDERILRRYESKRK